LTGIAIIMSAQTPAPFSRNKSYDILVIDDDPAAIQLITEILVPEFKVHSATDAKAGLEHVVRFRPPLVLLDMILPGVQGLELLDQILAADPGVDVILVTGHYSPESAVEAIQKGAYDYLTKPLQIGRFRQRMLKWLAEAEVRQRAFHLDHELLETFQLEGIVGRSPAMLEVFSRIRRIAPHFQTALITGATGTGKESAAAAIHRLSPAAAGPFVVCNCAAIPENLFESELFGHTKGAFTGATHDKAGFVEAANGGTLFLDEITEIPLSVQAKLLRLLQNREIQRLGTSRPKKLDIRIVAATNRDLQSLVSEKKLREDLYYRLAVIEVKLPCLAERKEDIPLLQRHFLDLFAERYQKPSLNLTRRAQAVLAAHSWPGNIRELESVLSYSCMLAEHETIDVKDLPPYLQGRDAQAFEAASPLMPMRSMELWHLRRVLDHVGGNREKAAEILEISRTTIYRLLQEEKQNSTSLSTLEELSDPQLNQASS